MASDDDQRALADRGISSFARRSRLADDTGPFYDTAALTRWQNVSRQALDKRFKRGTLLMCRTSDGKRCYPVWQFDNDGNVLVGIAEVIAIFRAAGFKGGWSIAKWLNVPNPDLNGEAASHLLARGEFDRVIAAARHSAMMLAN